MITLHGMQEELGAIQKTPRNWISQLPFSHPLLAMGAAETLHPSAVTALATLIWLGELATFMYHHLPHLLHLGSLQSQSLRVQNDKELKILIMFDFEATALRQ